MVFSKIIPVVTTISQALLTHLVTIFKYNQWGWLYLGVELTFSRVPDELSKLVRFC